MTDLGQSARSGWLDGIFGCFRPVFWNLASKANKGIKKLQHNKKKTPQVQRNYARTHLKTGDEWEIAFETLRDHEWLGSGAQGAVYKCRLRNEVVAVKRVKDKKEADIRHLRQLHHPNIIRFKYVSDYELILAGDFFKFPADSVS